MHPTPEHTASILGRLREQQAEVAANQTTTIPVAGYKDPQIVAKYRFLPTEESKELGQKVRGQFTDDQDRVLYSGIDLIAAACEGLYARESGSRLLIPILDDGDDLTFSDPRLADAFGWDTSTTREQVRALFKGNDYAVIEHSQLLQRWMSDTTIDIEKLLGEG